MRQRKLFESNLVIVEDVSVEATLRIRAAANKWVSQSFPTTRKFLSHTTPNYCDVDGGWNIPIVTKNLGNISEVVGNLIIDNEGRIAEGADVEAIEKRVNQKLADSDFESAVVCELIGSNYEFRLGDGIEAAKALPNNSVNLLLTDPPYGISKAYTCEKQIPRRLRKDGTDFIMPRGNFGSWDNPILPCDWVHTVLPKVSGWFVTFCAQAQIGDYCQILEEANFVAVGTLVWQKTNPVPFNHKYKPINAWEALVIGKRPGTKFNGKVVHNVFVHKSPSPQQRIHPTQKPLPLIEQFVELFSSEGDLVFDPFAGSATTLVAANRLHRKVIAYEKDLEIYHRAAKRIASMQD